VRIGAFSWIRAILVITSVLALAARCGANSDASLPVPSGFTLVSSGKVWVLMGPGTEYWIYGAEPGVKVSFEEISALLEDQGWDASALPPEGVGATDGSRCVAYDDFNSANNSFVTEVLDAIIDQKGSLPDTSAYGAVLLVKEFDCP
jgi:hypothetical protein